MRTVWLDGESLTPSTVLQISYAWRHPAQVTVAVDPRAAQRVRASREVIERMVEDQRIVYGVTTGFGALKDRTIPGDQVRALQRNLLLSHAVGVGSPLPEPVVRAMMVIRANALAKGYSGIRLAVIEGLLNLLNSGIHPIVPAQGSVGASGDLAPLAHMAVALIGRGEVMHHGERMDAGEALRRCELGAMELQAKEGVALINGTALMAALGCLAVGRAKSLLLTANTVAALSLEALGGTTAAFDSRLHSVRPHAGQVACAETLRRLLDGSTWVRASDQGNVQDAYTLRCIPQVYGAVGGVIDHVHGILQTEINSATDNPLVFLEGDDGTVLSGGNFHGEPLALAMDYLGLAITDLGNMAERRIARLLDASTNGGILPPFLADRGGVNSGFMLLQYTAAALASENKVLAHPAAADTIPTSANVEDHVSMGPIGARKAIQIIEHVETIVALELLCAAQGVDLRRKDQPTLQLGRGTRAAYDCLRTRVPALWTDDLMYPHIEASRRLVQDGEVTRSVAQALPELLVDQDWLPNNG
jgi:histidine ammonia-lyase